MLNYRKIENTVLYFLDNLKRKILLKRLRIVCLTLGFWLLRLQGCFPGTLIRVVYGSKKVEFTRGTVSVSYKPFCQFYRERRLLPHVVYGRKSCKIAQDIDFKCSSRVRWGNTKWGFTVIVWRELEHNFIFCQRFTNHDSSLRILVYCWLQTNFM